MLVDGMGIGADDEYHMLSFCEVLHAVDGCFRLSAVGQNRHASGGFRPIADMPERVTDGHMGYTEQLRIPPPDIEELGLVLIPLPSYPLARIRVSHG